MSDAPAKRITDDGDSYFATKEDGERLMDWVLNHWAGFCGDKEPGWVGKRIKDESPTKASE